ncbi:MAG: glucokinase [Chitinispirillaceae bacterium]|nr:glucokinase [Chitinispirillaceae bacterium]
MEEKWFNTDYNFDQVILAGDIGGTNTTLALVGRKNNKFTIMGKFPCKSSEVTSLIDPVNEVVAAAGNKNPDLKIDLCCIGAAGPVENNFCQPTNCSWAIDGKEIGKAIGVETLVINDFTAISYGIPTLDVEDKTQITRLPCTDGTFPEQTGGGDIKITVGAGTGLGVGYLISRDGKYRAYSSEGGHSGFADFDEETRELKHYVISKKNLTESSVGTEPFVSGMGIYNAFNFLKDTKKIKIEGVLKEIDATRDEDKPALISQHAKSNDVCRKIMRLFVGMYGRFAGNVSLIFLPTGGVYLAGGIASKNEEFFLEDNLFMKNFEVNYNPNIRPLLKKIPVYIIKDYSISLYGAANAGVTLLGK